MKKLLFVGLFAALMTKPTNTFAQKKYTPEAGTFSTEIGFNPFDQKGKVFKFESFKLRYFLTEKDAIRLNLGLGVNKNKQKEDIDKSDYISRRAGNFNIDLGYERHFLQKGRLDLYAGAQLGFGKDFVAAKT